MDRGRQPRHWGPWLGSPVRAWRKSITDEGGGRRRPLAGARSSSCLKYPGLPQCCELTESGAGQSFASGRAGTVLGTTASSRRSMANLMPSKKKTLLNTPSPERAPVALLSSGAYLYLNATTSWPSAGRFSPHVSPASLPAPSPLEMSLSDFRSKCSARGRRWCRGRRTRRQAVPRSLGRHPRIP